MTCNHYHHCHQDATALDILHIYVHTDICHTHVHNMHIFTFVYNMLSFWVYIYINTWTVHEQLLIVTNDC